MHGETSAEAAAVAASFGIEKESLHDLLKEVGRGDLQLPEFQRGWVWPVENIRSLLASISLAFPVGTLMMLRTGGNGVRFKHRLFEGATAASAVSPERLTLDGQQRLTSLFQALCLNQPVVTQDARKRPIAGWFYIEMEKALAGEGDREDAIRFIPGSRQVVNFRSEVVEDYSTPEKEYAACLFPLRAVFEPDAWHEGFVEFWGFEKSRFQQWAAFNRQVVQPFQKYQMPVIELGKNTPRQAVCQVFEKVNTGGVTLTVFELLTATFASSEYDLRHDWATRHRHWTKEEYKVVSGLKETDFLQSVTLLATRARRIEKLSAGEADDRAPRIGCRRTDMLDLELEAYRRHADEVERGLLATARFLHTQHIWDPRFLPYGSQLVPLSAIFAILSSTEAETIDARKKIAQWYWCGVLGELYGGTTETRFAADVQQVVAWVRDEAGPPRTIVDAVFSPNRLQTMRSRNSAAYKGVYALLLRHGACDWLNGDPISVHSYFDAAVDIHHVFPRAWCKAHGIPRDRRESIANKTPLSARANRVVIRGVAPSSYRGALLKAAKTTEGLLDAHVVSHLIETKDLWTDDFDEFFAKRTQALLAIIEDAMGKPAAYDVEDQAVEEDYDDEDDTDAV